MVAAAREAHPELDFRVGDAEDLPFATAAFDAALAAFVVNHLPHPGARRRPSGAASSRPAAGSPWRCGTSPSASSSSASSTPPWTRRTSSADCSLPPGPPAYRFADDAELRALLEGAGLDAVEIGAVDFAYTIGEPRRAVGRRQTGSVRTAAQLRALDDDERARVRGALDELLEQRRSTGGLELETAVKIAVRDQPRGMNSGTSSSVTDERRGRSRPRSAVPVARPRAPLDARLAGRLLARAAPRRAALPPS